MWLLSGCDEKVWAGAQYAAETVASNEPGAGTSRQHCGLLLFVCVFLNSQRRHLNRQILENSRKAFRILLILFFGWGGAKIVDVDCVGCLLLRRGLLGGLQRVLWPAGGRRLPGLPDAGQPCPSYPLPWLHHRGRGTNTHPDVLHLLCSNIWLLFTQQYSCESLFAYIIWGGITRMVLFLP